MIKMNDKYIDYIILIPSILITGFLTGTILIDYLETVQIPEFIYLSDLLIVTGVSIILYSIYQLYKHKEQ